MNRANRTVAFMHLTMDPPPPMKAASDPGVMGRAPVTEASHWARGGSHPKTRLVTPIARTDEGQFENELVPILNGCRPKTNLLLRSKHIFQANTLFARADNSKLRRFSSCGCFFLFVPFAVGPHPPPNKHSMVFLILWYLEKCLAPVRAPRAFFFVRMKCVVGAAISVII